MSSEDNYKPANPLSNIFTKKSISALIFSTCLLSTASFAIDKQAIPLAGPEQAKQQITSSAKYLASNDQSKVVPNEYIVVLDETRLGTNSRNKVALESFVSDFAFAAEYDMNATILHQYSGGVNGVAMQLDKEQLGKLLTNPDVKYIEENTISELVLVQNNPPSYGLDRIDERSLPLDNRYDSDFTGAGTNVYIIDTGIDLDHPNFAGRVRFGFDAIGDGRNGNDCQGHGTHVAGTATSETYGVAKDATVYAVRVFGCSGSTTTAAILSGMNWVNNNRNLPAVVNMSLGGPVSATQNNLVQTMTNNGIVVVVAAGNESQNACNVSPASAPAAITVGSTTSSDSRSGFSNFGSCVDIFAPGSSITSTWLNGGTNTISGTSMASPHVAGAAALVLDSNSGLSATAVANNLTGNATSGVISGANGSPNRLLYIAHLNGGTPPPPPPPPGSCSFEDDFGTSTGWTIGNTSTCSTGTYVRGNPNQQTTSGVITQVNGDSDGNNFAVYTASNTSVGNADVDGGVCVANSPTVSVNESSTLSVDWFHGQRDTGDDPSGDFFRVQYSLNGGSTFNNLVNLGDNRRQAAWTTSTASIPAGSSVVLRVSTSDGPNGGDIIEGGIDNVSICSQ